MTSSEKLAVVGPIVFWSVQDDDFSLEWNLEASLGLEGERVSVEDSRGKLIRNPGNNPVEWMFVQLTLDSEGNLDRVALIPA